jgi:hypothetical protein
MIMYPSVQEYELWYRYFGACFTSKNIETLGSLIDAGNAQVLGNFAGHIHGYFDPEKNWDPNTNDPLAKNPVFLDANWDYISDFSTPAGISVIGTEALMVGSNDPSSPMSKGAVRIVKVPQNTSPISTYLEEDIPSLNPYVRAMIYPVDRNPVLYALHHQVVVDFQGYAFTKRFNAAYPLRYKLYLDDILIREVSSSSTELVESKNHRLVVGTTHKIALEVYGDGDALLESITDRITIPSPEILHTYVYSPVDIIVTDPSGHTISKQVNDIPQATYTEADLDGDGDLDKLVLIVNPIGGDYVVTLNGTDAGAYDMISEIFTPQRVVNLNATDIPVSLGTTHQYTIDWDTLSQGGEGVTVQADSDGDGAYEHTFFSDAVLTGDEFTMAMGGPVVESCNSTGAVKDTFDLGDSVYVKGEGYSPSATYDLYVVNATTWSEGMPIPQRLEGTATTITSDTSGNISVTPAWNAPITLGNYDIVVDVNRDGYYNSSIDALDQSNVQIKAGFQTVPEFSQTTILVALMIITMSAIVLVRKKHYRNHHVQHSSKRGMP